MRVSGDLYAQEGQASIEVEREAEGFRFRWRAKDSAGAEIATGSKAVSFETLDDPRRPHAFLEQYIRTHIQKTVLKRKNRMKVTRWEWLER